MLMCCKPYRNILLYNYYTQLVHIWRRQYDDNRPLTFQSHARSRVTSLIDRVKYTKCDVTRDASSNRQLYQCNACNGRFTTLQSLRDNMWSTVPSTFIVTNWAAERSFTSVNLSIHTGERPFSCSVCEYQCQRTRFHNYLPGFRTGIIVLHCFISWLLHAFHT